MSLNLYKKNENKKIFEYILEGKKINFTINELAKKSDKSIVCRYGETVVLTTLTVKNSDNFSSFARLAVFFKERHYAVGRIPGNSSKREAGPTHDAIRSARFIDRSLRSFFPLRMDKEVQITNLVLSLDSEHDSRLAAIWNSFLVCLLSPELPFFNKTLASVIVTREEKSKLLICNPSSVELNENCLELIVSGDANKITMLEVKAFEINEKELEDAIIFAHQKIKLLTGFFGSIADEMKCSKESAEEPLEKTDSLAKTAKKKIENDLRKILSDFDFSSWAEKENRLKSFYKEIIKEHVDDNFSPKNEKAKMELECLWESVLKDEAWKIWQTKRVRLDGRGFSDIRPVNIEIDFLPSKVHASALFERGYTQTLSSVTLGDISEKQSTDSIWSTSPDKNIHKHFFHHYDFWSFSTNEIVNRSHPNNREIGHGNLIEKTFLYLLPPVDLFPYTIRTVSEVLSSDGSSSQASICSTSLALMCAGVPLLNSVSGISIGLSREQLYVDVTALEDQYISEMDFKIAGTKKGVCSIQLDVKNDGLTIEVLSKVLVVARQARMEILKKMDDCINSSRPDLSVNARKHIKLYVGNNKIGMIVGSGGNMLRSLFERYKVLIKVQTDGYIIIYYHLEEDMKTVRRMIQNKIADH